MGGRPLGGYSGRARVGGLLGSRRGIRAGRRLRERRESGSGRGRTRQD